jgi:hypothetical protein
MVIDFFIHSIMSSDLNTYLEFHIVQLIIREYIRRSNSHTHGHVALFDNDYFHKNISMYYINYLFSIKIAAPTKSWQS